MKRILFLSIVLFLSIFSASAGKIVTDSIYSSVLSSELKFNVYLPDGFDRTNKLYPVVYLLHGLSDDYTAWKTKGNMQLVADELISSGEADEMVIVMPGAGGPDTRNVQCGYFNVENWSYEDFFFTELLPFVEKKYRCIGDKGHRAIMGLSMGGGGSTVYCQRHPDFFSSCYAMSAWLENKGSQVNSGSRDNRPKDKLDIVCDSVNEHSALDFMDNADQQTIEKLRTVNWFFDCGDDDFLFEQSVNLHLKMRKAQVKDELRIRNGVHNWEYWHLALRLALPFVSRNFE